MVCSEVLDGVVCIECMCPLFLVSQKGALLFALSYMACRRKMKNKLSHYHQEAMKQADA